MAIKKWFGDIGFWFALWKTNKGFVWQMKVDIYNVRLASYFEKIGNNDLFQIYMLISSQTKKVMVLTNGLAYKIFIYIFPRCVIEKK